MKQSYQGWGTDNYGGDEALRRDWKERPSPSLPEIKAWAFRDKELHFGSDIMDALGRANAKMETPGVAYGSAIIEHNWNLIVKVDRNNHVPPDLIEKQFKQFAKADSKNLVRISSPLDRVKYPRTYHLPWSEGATSDDKMHADDSIFAGMEVVVTEKMDGENMTIYPDGYIHARSTDWSYHPTRTYAKGEAARIAQLLDPSQRIVVENVHGTHSIQYNNLPGFLFLLSVWEGDICQSWDDTEFLAQYIELPLPRVLYRGLYDADKIRSLWSPEGNFGASEGYVIRNAAAFPGSQFSQNVAKFVRANHIQTDDHWSQGAPSFNELQSFSRVANDPGSGWQTVEKGWRRKEWGEETDQTDAPNISDGVKDLPMTDTYTCPDCGKQFTTHGEYESHVNKHGIKPEVSEPVHKPYVDLDKTLPANYDRGIILPGQFPAYTGSLVKIARDFLSAISEDVLDESGLRSDVFNLSERPFDTTPKYRTYTGREVPDTSDPDDPDLIDARNQHETYAGQGLRVHNIHDSDGRIIASMQWLPAGHEYGKNPFVQTSMEDIAQNMFRRKGFESNTNYLYENNNHVVPVKDVWIAPRYRESHPMLVRKLFEPIVKENPDKYFASVFANRRLGELVHRRNYALYRAMNRNQVNAAWIQIAETDTNIRGPIPFLYDVHEDDIHVGRPGDKQVDDDEIKFKVDGVVEGFYYPDGKMQIRTITDVPYTIKHLIQLWYYMHPELEVKSVTIMRKDGKEEKVAKTSTVGPSAFDRIAYLYNPKTGEVHSGLRGEIHLDIRRRLKDEHPEFVVKPRPHPEYDKHHLDWWHGAYPNHDYREMQDKAKDWLYGQVVYSPDRSSFKFTDPYYQTTINQNVSENHRGGQYQMTPEERNAVELKTYEAILGDRFGDQLRPDVVEEERRLDKLRYT